MLNTKLYTLIAVTETLNLTQAAEKLGFTQPAISQHIKALENELGAKLVVRRDTGINLTKAGEITVNYALKLLEVYDKLKSDIKQSDTDKIKITIGVDVKSLRAPLTTAISNLINGDDEYQVKLVFEEIKKLYNLIDSDDVDLLITDATPCEDYSFTTLYEDNLYAYITPDGVKDFNLLSSPFILRQRPCKATEIFIEALKEAGVQENSINVIAKVNSLATAKKLVDGNLGASIMFESEVNANDNFIAIPLLDKKLTSSIHVIYKKDFNRLSFIDAIKNYFNN